MNKGKEIPDRETMDPVYSYLLYQSSLAILPPGVTRKAGAGPGAERFENFVLFEVEKYKGRSAPELAHSPGRLKLGESVTLEGEFRCGRPRGVCVLRGVEGVTEFLLFFQAGQQLECKRISYADGVVYQGRTIRHSASISRELFLAHGHGKTTYLDGSYEGEHQLGLRHGRGKYTFVDGKVSEGSWEKGKLNGEVVITYPNGNRYEGSMRNDSREGKGTLYYANGDRMEGTWKEGQLNGPGLFRRAGGSLYEGEFLADLRHGKGKFRNDTRQLDGTWSNDRVHGKGLDRRVVGSELQSVYEGDYANDLWHGHGILHEKTSGVIYIGEFCNGKKHGKGISKGPDFEYNGEFFAGLRHGRGQLTDKYGTREVFHWAGFPSQKESERPAERKPHVLPEAKRQREDETELEPPKQVPRLGEK